MTGPTLDGSHDHDSALEAWLAHVGRTGEAPSYSPVYRLKLAGPTPKGLRAFPKDPRPADPARGKAIMSGDWRFGAAQIEIPPDHAPWGPPFPTPHFADRIHRFNWLRDVASHGNEGEARARSLTAAWVDRYGKWEAFAWRLSVTADRVINLLSAGPWLIDGLQGQAREDLLDTLTKQSRHLHISGEEETDPAGRYRVAIALCLAGAALDDQSQLDDGLAMLEKECAVQILADGGHASRSPEALANALLDIQSVEDLLLRLGINAPTFLNRLQSRMSAMLGFFTLPGGSLLPVNGGGEGANGLATAALQPYGDTASRFTFARLSGFQRVQAESLTLYMDAGGGPEKQMGGRAHAGTLAIYVADGSEMMFTACGAHPDLEPVLSEASRQTAAHSVLAIPGSGSAQFVADLDSGLRAPAGPPGISARRLEENDQFLLEGQHGGWRARHGLIYRRRIYVERDGTRMTGEDSLSRPVSETSAGTDKEIPFEIRFHLHPNAQIAPGDDPQTVFIGLPEQKSVWRFRSEALLSIDDSRYWGVRGTQKTSQLVVRGSASSLGDGSKAPNRVRWALLRIE